MAHYLHQVYPIAKGFEKWTRPHLALVEFAGYARCGVFGVKPRNAADTVCLALLKGEFRE